MIVLPNILSLLRMPLALAFLQENVTIRSVALILAMLTDCFDGFLARRYKCTSDLGRILDPLADKCFVISVLTVLCAEHRLELWEVFAMISREISVFFFGVYLYFKGKLFTWQFRSIWSGKIATTIQFAIIYALIWSITIPPYIYLMFIPLGLAAFAELFISRRIIKIEE